MFVPYSTEVLITRWPIANVGVILTCVVLLFLAPFDSSIYASMRLDGWDPLGFMTYPFLHADIIHLFFNMLFLWVFGNAVCEKVGNLTFLLVFLSTGIISGIAHNLFHGGHVVGASGAINGIIGFYLVLHPFNRVNVFYCLLIRFGTFSLSAYWIILFWFAGDLYNATAGSVHGVAYWAHVGGFVSGFLLGLLLLQTKLINMASYDNPTLLDYFTKHAKNKKTGPDRSRQSKYNAKAKQADKGINLDCPHCGQNMSIPFDMIGETLDCPSCKGEIRLGGGGGPE